MSDGDEDTASADEEGSSDPEESADVEPTEDGAADGEPAEDGAADGEPAEDGAADGEPAEDGAADGEPAEDGAADDGQTEEEETVALDPETFEKRLDDAAAELKAAETEAELDELETTLDDIAADLEAADLPGAGDGDGGDGEDESDSDGDDSAPAEALPERLEELQTALEERRGPYPEEIAGDVRSVADTVAETRWTAVGEVSLRIAAARFLARTSAVVDALPEATSPLEVEPDVAAELSPGGDEGPADEAGETAAADEEDEGDEASEISTIDPATIVQTVEDPESASGPEALAGMLRDVGDAVEESGLHPDEDEAALDALVAAADTLATAVEDAQEWDDLTVREQLRVEGFYDALGEKHKDFPPEWSALKQWEQRDDVEMVLLGLEKFGSEFMERHCIESLERMGHPDAIDAMLERAQRRDKPAIRVLGTTGVARDDVLEALHEFLGGDPGLVQVTLESLGQIGNEESTQHVADLLAADAERVRSQAARTLGLIGDTRAIRPLADLLDEGDAVDSVRASAAWALVQIGTDDALEAAAEHAADSSYLVEAEAKPAAAALDGSGDAVAAR